MNSKETSVAAIGSSLLEHSRGANFTARGLIEDLFPYIVQASKRMSTRAISKFLEEKHGVKISFVTIGKALRNPEKNWSAYYDQVERSAWIVSESHEKPLKYFISESEKYQEMLEAKPAYVLDRKRFPDEHDAASFAISEYEEALRILDEKWYCFEDATLEEARRYLIQRFAVKPPEETEAVEDKV